MHCLQQPMFMSVHSVTPHVWMKKEEKQKTGSIWFLQGGHFAGAGVAKAQLLDQGPAKYWPFKAALISIFMHNSCTGLSVCHSAACKQPRSMQYTAASLTFVGLCNL